MIVRFFTMMLVWLSTAFYMHPMHCFAAGQSDVEIQLLAVPMPLSPCLTARGAPYCDGKPNVFYNSGHVINKDQVETFARGERFREQRQDGRCQCCEPDCLKRMTNRRKAV